MSSPQKYSGRGYWVVQIGFSALLAVLGLAGGVFILVDSGSPSSTSSTTAGDGAIVLLVGIVFLLLLIWLVVGYASQSRQQRAIYAWAIMQDYVARNPGARPLRPGRAVAGDVASMAIAAQARDGRLSSAEVLRLQALRPEVPYPGDLDALIRKEEIARRAALEPEERARLRQAWAADDAAARARLDAAGLGGTDRARAARWATRVIGWAAVIAFVIDAALQSPPAAMATFFALLVGWCVARLVEGIIQDVRTRRGHALADEWLADPVRAARGLPTPFVPFFEAPLGAWWMRMLTPMMLIGIFFIIGGAANIGRAADSTESGIFVGMATVSAALFLASIALRVVAAKRSDTDRRRLDAYRRGRDTLEPSPGEA